MGKGAESRIPAEAVAAARVLDELLGSDLVGIYLFGSAVMGGLRGESDVDLLAIAAQGVPVGIREKIITRMMAISGKPGDASSPRPLEVIVVNVNDVVPWQYLPRRQLIYGEWLRDRFQRGEFSVVGRRRRLVAQVATGSVSAW